MLSGLLVESWRRQAACLNDLVDFAGADRLDWKASEDGWSIGIQLCHVHQVRSHWLRKASGLPFDELPEAFAEVNGEWVPLEGYEAICGALRASAAALESWLAGTLDQEGPAGNYDHPVFLLQHMIWHEGYHVGLILLALRLGGAEPSEEWEEEHLWSRWRVDDWE